MRHRLQTVGAVPTEFELRYGVQAPYDYRYQANLHYQQANTNPVVAILAPTDPVSAISAPTVLSSDIYYIGGSRDFDETAEYGVVPLPDDILNAEAVGTPIKALADNPKLAKGDSIVYAGGSREFDETAPYEPVDQSGQLVDSAQQEGGIPWGAIGLGLLFLL